MTADESQHAARREVQRLLVVVPNWVGDVVLATPLLAALRARFAGARVTYLMRRHVSEILAGGGWHDDELYWPQAPRGTIPARTWWRLTRGGPVGLVRLARQLASERYDLALLLTNSLRSALVAWLAGIPRRVGYAREFRSPLLTDALEPLRLGGDYVPVPMLAYYAELARAVGCDDVDNRLRLVVTPDQETGGRALQAHYGLTPRRYAVVIPGAKFGAAKCWLPERFAEVCDGLHERRGLTAVLAGSSDEQPLLRRIAGLARGPVVVCENPATTLGTLKPLVRDAAVLVCNDTGPRHYGLAFDVPTVTIFGPTFQEWTDTDHPAEVKLQARVPCGPCQLKRCPLDLVCMRRVGTADVLAAVDRLLSGRHEGTEARRHEEVVG
jgi:heptosyltransferase-2